MKRFGFYAALLLGVSLLGGPVSASDYAPLQPGEQATFEGGLGGNQTVQVSIDRTQGNWKHYTDFAGFGPLWLWTSSSSDRVYIWSTSLGIYQLFVDPAAGVNSSKRIDVGSCNRGEVRIDRSDVTVTTPAGTFQDCLSLELTTSCRDAGTIQAYLAPGVGLVKWSQSSLAGPRDYELVSGTINGQSYPQLPKSLSITGVMPHPEVFINMMPSPTIRRLPPSVRAGIELTNNQGHDLLYQFNGSSLRIEIKIFDAQGNQVSTSTRDKAITRDIARFTMKEGETWRFDDEVQLVDDNGQVLQPGVYTVRAELRAQPSAGTSIPVGGIRPRAESTILVDHVR